MARHREFNKDKALQKAMEVFWLKGYEATSIKNLEEAMGIHRGSIYDTFGDKQSLYLATLEHYQKIHFEGLQALFERTESALEAIRILLHDLARGEQGNLQRGCFMNNAMVETAPHDPKVAEITSCNTDMMVAEIATVLKRGQAQKEIRADKDAHALAEYLVSSVQGIKVMAKSGSSPDMLSNIIDVTITAIQA